MKQKQFDSKLLMKVRKAAKVVRLSSDYKFFKMGAVIFTNKKILVAAANENKTNPLQGEYDRYRGFDLCHHKSCIHAEMNALLKLRRLYPGIRGEDLAVFIYRETKDGHAAMAKPCPACEKALRDFGISHVYYSGKDSLCYENYLEEALD